MAVAINTALFFCLLLTALNAGRILCFSLTTTHHPFRHCVLLAHQANFREINMGEKSSQSKGSVCQFCERSFASRNALFKHLRNDPVCSRQGDNGAHRTTMVRKSFALQFSYQASSDITALSHEKIHLAELAGRILEEEFVGHIQKGNRVGCEKVTVISRTQSSLARLRDRALQQDRECMACGDTLVLTLNVPQFIVDTEALLNGLIDPLLWPNCSAEKDGIRVGLVACKILQDKLVLHAERGCTQFAYHYILPIKWLPQSDELKMWIQGGSQGRPNVTSLRRFKELCRSVESRRLSPEEWQEQIELAKGESPSSILKLAAGRFGSLGYRERRPFHNFCNLPVSPNHETSWRVVDRCRMACTPLDDHLVLEVRGDAMLEGQVRKLIAVIVAMTNGWLKPSLNEFVNAAALIDTPLAPIGRLYLAETRFHFEEIRTGEETLFESEVLGEVRMISSLADRMQALQNYIKEETAQADEEELAWLENLENQFAPKMNKSLDTYLKQDNSSSLPLQGDEPAEYEEVLTLLKEIVDRQEWPETSAARSEVIRKENAQPTATRGSFTVTNIDLEEPMRGNQLFPELSKAVFELEERLSSKMRTCITKNGIRREVEKKRLASSHCAINCDAQFTPHVDSGRGAGQSISMIVSLGCFGGGGLRVEGDSYDIRYKPLEFDGWNLRHWTDPFIGQRFSLVWFTPEK